MKLPAKYRNAVAFASACKVWTISPRDMAELSVLAHRAFLAVERETYIRDYSADPARERFNTKANALWLNVDWSNPAPYCTRGGVEVRIPQL